MKNAQQVLRFGTAQRVKSDWRNTKNILNKEARWRVMWDGAADTPG